MEAVMRQIISVLLMVLVTVSVAVSGTIDGTIDGWSAQWSNPTQPAVVWLEGKVTFKASKIRPVMAQRGGQFVPPFLVVVAGQTVDMPNEDDVAHNVYSLSAAKSFNLGYYAKGDHKSVTFDRPGVVDARCLIHSFMTAKILVVPNPYYAIIEPDGNFRIRHVPAGRFTLTLWSPSLTMFREEVTVPAGNRRVTLRIPAPQTITGK